MIADYYGISQEALGHDAKIPILKLGDSGEVFYELAVDMIRGIKANNAAGRRTVYIVPVGPVGQYPIFVRLVNRDGIDLRNCWFINMDEYLDDAGKWIDERDSLSFRGSMKRNVYEAIRPGLLMPEEQRVFPNPGAPEALDSLVESLGGVDAVYGGVGINGHIAFNEPEPGMTPENFSMLGTRVVVMTPETVTTNAIGSLGGALAGMPGRAVTVGIKQVLGASKIRLGLFRDWHRAVVRRAAYGAVEAAFPVTLLQRHPDAMLLVTAAASGNCL